MLFRSRARYLAGTYDAHRCVRLHPFNSPLRLPVLPSSLLALSVSSERGLHSLFPALDGCYLGYHSRPVNQRCPRFCPRASQTSCWTHETIWAAH